MDRKDEFRGFKSDICQMFLNSMYALLLEIDR